MRPTILLVLSLCALSFASYVKDWDVVGPAAKDEQLTFHIALHQRNLDKLEELLYAISDPHSPIYGKQATEEEIANLVYPPKEEHDRVLNFITKDRPSVTVHSYGDGLKVTATVKDISDIFSATFYWYRHNPSGHKAIRTDYYTGIVIPKEIANDIYMVTGLVSFPIIMKKKVTPLSMDSRTVTDTDYGFFAPSTIRRIYNIPQGTTVTNAQSSQCALEFYPEGAFTFPDLVQFCKTC